MDQAEIDSLNASLEEENEIREKIKESVGEFDKRSRSIVGVLSKIHGTPLVSIPAHLDTVRPLVKECAECIKSIMILVPEDQYWRWAHLWSHPLRSTIFAAVLIEYLSNENLLSQAGVAEALGIEDEKTSKLIIQAEDYLHGLITMVNELSRWAVNVVTMGDFERPIRISLFVKDIFTGFSMLNLKNDGLRRRFDSLKYDIKKIEEVVYDVSLRGLADPKSIKASD